MTPPAWDDWLSESFFRVRVAPAAAEKLQQLPPKTQDRLRQILHDITEVADLAPPSSAVGYRAGDGASLLQLQMGRVNVRYSISEQNRTLTIEHVIIPSADEMDSTG
jgi:mRNA-degrading endonuclease RelE of RelBE toxin-antitoxin system